MKTKVSVLVLVLVLALAAGYALRSGNRADASPSDCYSDSKGPSEPTVCN